MTQRYKVYTFISILPRSYTERRHPSPPHPPPIQLCPQYGCRRRPSNTSTRPNFVRSTKNILPGINNQSARERYSREEICFSSVGPTGRIRESDPRVSIKTITGQGGPIGDMAHIPRGSWPNPTREFFSCCNDP